MEISQPDEIHKRTTMQLWIDVSKQPTNYKSCTGLNKHCANVYVYTYTASVWASLYAISWVYVLHWHKKQKKKKMIKEAWFNNWRFNKTYVCSNIIRPIRCLILKLLAINCKCWHLTNTDGWRCALTMYLHQLIS